MSQQKIIEIIAEQLGLEENEVTLEKSFINDLNADSLDLTELMMSLESEFGVEIPDDHVEKLNTVGDVVAFLSAHAKV